MSRGFALKTIQEPSREGLGRLTLLRDIFISSVVSSSRRHVDMLQIFSRCRTLNWVTTLTNLTSQMAASFGNILKMQEQQRFNPSSPETYLALSIAATLENFRLDNFTSKASSAIHSSLKPDHSQSFWRLNSSESFRWGWNKCNYFVFFFCIEINLNWDLTT